MQNLPAWTRELRADVIRMIAAAGSGHPGGSLSVVDLLAVLYARHLRHDPKRPDWPERDRLILSKGHACPALYAVLARRGFFPQESLLTLRRLGSPLQGHPERHRLPGIEASTGSLGQGLSIGLGLALAARLDRRDWRVYVVTGDGELQEGQVWEAAMAAAKFKLGNLTLIADCNDGQLDGPVHEIMPLAPLADKFAGFNWDARVIAGHDLGAIDAALAAVKSVPDRPQAILAKTVKGKGVSFMEGDHAWHGKAPGREEAEQALREMLGA